MRDLAGYMFDYSVNNLSVVDLKDGIFFPRQFHLPVPFTWVRNIPSPINIFMNEMYKECNPMHKLNNILSRKKSFESLMCMLS